jgi:Resolvase, N terminal domain
MGRDGLLHLMDRARDRSFEVIIVEALDRLSRDMEDLAGIHKRLSFLGIEIRAVHESVMNTVLVGLQIAVPPIIEAEEFEAVQQFLRQRSPQLKATPLREQDNAFGRHMLLCGLQWSNDIADVRQREAVPLLHLHLLHGGPSGQDRM